jgi:hypothetical protein
MVDAKYNTQNPKLFFCSKTAGVSQFWEGVMWVVQSIKFGYRWQLGDGSKVRFWEDTWFGTSPLAVQFFDIYILCNEHNMTIQNIWGGSQLKLTFRRNFNYALMHLWYELEAIANNISFYGSLDALIWKYENTGVYSTSSLYYQFWWCSTCLHSCSLEFAYTT